MFVIVVFHGGSRKSLVKDSAAAGFCLVNLGMPRSFRRRQPYRRNPGNYVAKVLAGQAIFTNCCFYGGMKVKTGVRLFPRVYLSGYHAGSGENR
jgi:hypothetical protein